MAFTDPDAPGTSWLHKVFFATYNAMKNRGGNIDSPSMSPTWLRAIDTLTDVGWHKEFVPIGPWVYGNTKRTHKYIVAYLELEDERERVLS